MARVYAPPSSFTGSRGGSSNSTNPADIITRTSDVQRSTQQLRNLNENMGGRSDAFLGRSVSLPTLTEGYNDTTGRLSKLKEDNKHLKDLQAIFNKTFGQEMEKDIKNLKENASKIFNAWFNENDEKIKEDLKKEYEAANTKLENKRNEFIKKNEEADKRMNEAIQIYGEGAKEIITGLVEKTDSAIKECNGILEEVKTVRTQMIKNRAEFMANHAKATLAQRIKFNLADTADAYDIQLDSKYQGVGEKLGKMLFTKILNSNILQTELLSGAGAEAKDLSLSALRKKGIGLGSAFGTSALAAGVNFGQSAFSAKSGSDLGFGSGGALNTGIGMIAGAGPIGLAVQALLAALNRFNEIGQKALKLFEGTAGRYGYGEGFNMSEAQQFINFQSTARKLSAEYAVNLQDVEAAFQGLQEYSGVRTFDQLKKLASATLEISNATGLATSEITKLGSAYQKNFGYGAQESVSKAGKQLLGLMNSINSGLTSNLLVTNAEMAALVQNLIEGTQGADVTKTLIPFLDAAFDRVKDLGIQSRVVGDLLRNQMMDLKKSGAGLPGGLPSFMLAAGGLFTNRLGGAEAGIASQVGRGKFAYEQGQEMARITTGPARNFWSSPKLILRNDLVDLAFKLKSGDLASLLASQSDAALGQITQRIFELYQIPGAAEAIGVSLAQITEKFSTIARNNPLQFKLLGGDLDKLTALSEYSKAEATLKTGRVGGTGPMATEEQMKAASETRKAMVAQMTPVDRTNQLLEQIVGFVDQIVVWMGDSMFFGKESGEELTARRGGLTEEEYKTLGQLTQMPQRDAEQQKQMDLLRGKQNEFRGKSTATVSPVNGSVTTTVVMDNPPYSKSIAAAYASGAGRSIGQS